MQGAISKSSGYDTSTSVEELQKTYEYNETCQRTAPERFVKHLNQVNSNSGHRFDSADQL